MKVKNCLTVLWKTVVLSVMFAPLNAFAVTKDEFIELLLKDKAKDAVKQYLYFDGTTLWVMIASFIIALGMIKLSSDVAKHFVGGGAGSGDVGKMVYGTMAGLVGGAVGATINAGRAGNTLRRNANQLSDLESKTARENRSYNTGNGNGNGSNNGGNGNGGSGNGNNNGSNNGGNGNNNGGSTP